MIRFCCTWKNDIQFLILLVRNLLNLISTGYYIIFLKCMDPYSQNIPDIFVLMVFMQISVKVCCSLFFPLLTEAVIHRNALGREGLWGLDQNLPNGLSHYVRSPHSTVLTKYIKLSIPFHRGHSSYGSRWLRDRPLTCTKRIFWQKISYFMSLNQSIALD